MQADRWIYRHAAIVRVTHWINLLCLTILLMSGLQIFNAHPALYLGEQSSFDRPVLSMTAELQGNGFAGARGSTGNGTLPPPGSYSPIL
jgi:hypothetical protein